MTILHRFKFVSSVETSSIAKVRRLILSLLAFVVSLSACSTSLTPGTQAFIEAEDVGQLAAYAGGGLAYANYHTGEFYKVREANAASEPIGSVTVSRTGLGVTGLTIDKQDRVFAAYVNADNALTVAQVAPGPTRVVWQGPAVGATNVAGRLTLAPNGRLVLSIGDLGDPSKVNEPSAINGKLLTLDPDRGTDQSPNAVSNGWTNPLGIAYSAYDMLWVADNNKLGRSGDSGFTGQVTDLDRADLPVSMTKYGDKEFVLCMGGTHKLQRYTLDGGIKAVAGRVLADDCETSVTQLKDGRLAYSTSTGIRTTIL